MWNSMLPLWSAAIRPGSISVGRLVFKGSRYNGSRSGTQGVEVNGRVSGW